MNVAYVAIIKPSGAYTHIAIPSKNMVMVLQGLALIPAYSSICPYLDLPCYVVAPQDKQEVVSILERSGAVE